MLYYVLEKNIDSSSKSNPFRRRRKKITTRRHEGGGAVVTKSRRTSNTNYCDLLTAISLSIFPVRLERWCAVAKWFDDSTQVP